MNLSSQKVGYVLQQELLQLDKRSYSPPQDPNWTSQWSLVSKLMTIATVACE